jgi:hypothetical protein
MTTKTENLRDRKMHERVAGILKERMLRRDPMMDEVAIRLNMGPTYNEIERVRYILETAADVLELSQ